MNGFPWLTLAVAVPLVGSVVVALLPRLPADSAGRRTGRRAGSWPSCWRWGSRC